MVLKSEDYQKLSTILNYSFEDKQLLERALNSVPIEKKPNKQVR